MLSKVWPDIYGKEFNLNKLTRKLHLARPWKSSHTRELAENFYNYLLEEHSEILTAAPIIKDCLLLELYTLEVRRLANDPAEVSELPPFQVSANSKVEELLNIEWTVPGCARFQEFNYDVVTAYKEFYSKDFEPDLKQPAALTFACGSRNHDRFVRWESTSKPIFELLMGSVNKWKKLSELAEIYLTLPTTSKDEVQAFTDFLTHIILLNKAGVLSIKP